MRSSKIVRAGDGGICESNRLTELTGLMTGLVRAEEAAELARDRRSSTKPSSVSPEARLDLQRVDMVEMCELMRDTPFMEESEQRFCDE
jgi:hypothetical protein